MLAVGSRSRVRLLGVLLLEYAKILGSVSRFTQPLSIHAIVNFGKERWRPTASREACIAALRPAESLMHIPVNKALRLETQYNHLLEYF